jgi:hypothetical protein
VDEEVCRQAGKLIQFGLRPNLFPGQDREYKDLLRLYWDRTEFREVVDALAEGLGLTVSSPSSLGFFLSAQPGSVFAYTLSVFRRDRGTQASYEDRLLHGIGMVAIVAYLYPNAHDLEDERYLTATPVDVDHFLRAACDELERRAGDADLPEDPDFEQAWQLYQRQKEAIETPDGRRPQRGTVAMLARCFDLLADQGLVRRTREEGDNPPFVPMDRMRIQVASVAGNCAYRTLGRIRREQQEAAAG